MSRYTTYYHERQQMYRNLAINWKKFTDEHMHLTAPQKTGMRLFFIPIAERFGLTKDFRDIGVL